MFEKNEVGNFFEGLNSAYSQAFEQWVINAQEVGVFWVELYKKYFETVMHCPFEGTVLFGLAKEHQLTPFKFGEESSPVQKEVVKSKEAVAVEKPALTTLKKSPVVKVNKPVAPQVKKVVEKAVEAKQPESVLSALVKAVKEKPVAPKKPLVKKVAVKKPAVKAVVAKSAESPLIKVTETKVAPKRAQVKEVVNSAEVKETKVEVVQKVEPVQTSAVEANKAAE